MNFDFRQLFNVFSRMSPRERTLLSVAGLSLVLICLYSFVLDPLVSGQARLAAEAVRKEKDLQTIAELRTRYLTVAQKLESGQSLISQANPDFSLFTYLETTISQVIPRQRITSMSPDTKEVGENYEEQMVEFKIIQVSLDQLVDLLFRIEKSEHPLRVTRLKVKKRPNDIRNFDVIATVSLVRATA